MRFKEGESKQERANSELLMVIKSTFEERESTYGSPRLTAFLKEQGERCSENRMIPLMKQHGYMARGKAVGVTTNSALVLKKTPNLGNQGFRVERPNLIWCSDITGIPTQEGWLYFPLSWILIHGKWEVEIPGRD